MRRLLCSVPFILMAAACGGGGSSGAPASPPPPPPPPPPSANNAPEFTSTPTLSVAENTSGVIYTFEVSDPDGDEVTLAAVKSSDILLFDLNTDTGELSPAAALDFDSPADEDKNNVYELTVEATDDQGAATRFTLNLTVTDVAERGTIITISDTFEQPVYVTPIPGTERLAVVQKGGLIFAYNPTTGALGAPFLNVEADTSSIGERGLLGLAFSPDFETDRTLYVNVTNTSGDTEIRRYQMFSGSSTQADPSTKDVILTVAQPESNHNAGWIGFSNDGLLYVPLGDGGGSGDPNEKAQDPNELLGKILRLDVTGDDYPADDLRDYAIPAGNPFIGGGGRPEIFALGVRNPYRGSVDPVTGDFFFGDVGQNAIEEINRLPADGAGTNFGWDTREGTQEFEGPDDPAFTEPVAEYAHGSGPFEGNSVTGGYVYRGNIEAIQNHYVFGDFASGNFWSVPETDLVIGETVPSSSFQRLNDVFEGAILVGGMSSFGLDQQGRLLIQNFSGNLNGLEDQQ
ncbi:PQQ-dependent sugar dehydrogenase [Henriciella marina]|uniref:PQQ-dependent sugar dehydrogenase n=1 Tax=Henriciella marina TaxID=453851 RepID=UPI0003AAE05B|nr:PQQ-dependent sugar dehydrogenase [Henriciella marina]